MSMNDKIQIAHGGGGRLSSQLIEEEILSRFNNKKLKSLPDAANLEKLSNRIIYSTDSYVVNPLEFPGGNIGDLAVHGTVNDISMEGGKPLWLSLALIIEEGFEISFLRKILDSIKNAADECGVEIVTGDTKIVAKGQCDGIYINTSGIGKAYENLDLNKNNISPGDSILVSGSIGDHGMAILSSREGIDIKNSPESDTASVQKLVEIADCYGTDIKFMRDPTRGGIAGILNEIVTDTDIGIVLDDEKIPVSSKTASLSEILGIDVMNLACEGRMILVCDSNVKDDILRKWQKTSIGKDAAFIGTVTEDKEKVILKTVTGGSRLVDVPLGELLPRIC